MTRRQREERTDRQKAMVITWRGQNFEGKGRQEAWPKPAAQTEGPSMEFPSPSRK